jgi:hypothetical protein
MTIPNQARDSSQAGYLQPGRTDQFVLDTSGAYGLDHGYWTSLQLEGPALEDYIQQFVAGVAGLDGTLVRPRYQPEPPNLPDFSVTWCAVGIVRKRPIGVYGATIHDPVNDGHDLVQRHEDIDVLASFYGPQCDYYAANLHSGLMIWQNKSALAAVGMAFVEIGEGTRAPEFIKNQWLDRIDKPLWLRRIIQRVYPVLNILEAAGTVTADPGTYTASFDTDKVSPAE